MNEDGTDYLGDRELREEIGEVYAEATESEVGAAEFDEARLKVDGETVETLSGGLLPFDHTFSGVDFSEWDGRATQVAVEVELLLPDGTTESGYDEAPINTSAGAMAQLRSEASGEALFIQSGKTPDNLLDVDLAVDGSSDVDRALNFIAQYEELFGLEAPKDVLVPLEVWTDRFGETHVNFQQHVQGVLIPSTDLTVHLDGSTVRRFGGHYFSQDVLDSASQQIEMFREGERVALEEARETARIRLTEKTGAVDWNPVGTSRPMLVRIPDTRRLQLTWRVSLAGIHIPTGQTVRGTVYVGYDSGEVVMTLGTENPGTIRHADPYVGTVADAGSKPKWSSRVCYAGLKLQHTCKPITSGDPADCGSSVDNDGENVIDFSDDFDGYLEDEFGLQGPTGKKMPIGVHARPRPIPFWGTVNAAFRVGGHAAQYHRACTRTQYKDQEASQGNVFHEFTHELSHYFTRLDPHTGGRKGRRMRRRQG